MLEIITLVQYSLINYGIKNYGCHSKDLENHDIGCPIANQYRRYSPLQIKPTICHYKFLYKLMKGPGYVYLFIHTG